MLALAVLLAAATPAATTVASPGPDRVALTIYRNPWRGRSDAMNLRFLGGFALVTETRTLHVPAGDATLRFEGVADGIVPASAIVTGLPGGVVEKDRDARLLSPAALVDGTLGRDVTLRRTDKKTGKIVEQDATIIAGPGNGVVLQTSTGIETLRCSGLPEGLTYGGVPAGLSAKPVLSVETHSPAAADVTVTLSYLADGFDWSASYVATIAPAGDRLDLFGWLTLANANAEGWSDVRLEAVAGRLNRQGYREIAARAQRLELRCYPLGTTTSDLPVIRPYERSAGLDEIVVTGARRFMLMAPAPAAPPPPPPPPPPPAEDLGDLKLYRIPEPVDVAAHGQKQVALLAKPRIPFAKVYRLQVYPWAETAAEPATISLRVDNSEKTGLGVPLPAGTTSLYQPVDGATLLLGTGSIGDTAKGEKTRLTAGVSNQVLVAQRIDNAMRHVTVTNANPFPVPIEVAIGSAGLPAIENPGVPVARIDGVETWTTTVRANGSAVLTYRVKR